MLVKESACSVGCKDAETKLRESAQRLGNAWTLVGIGESGKEGAGNRKTVARSDASLDNGQTG